MSKATIGSLILSSLSRQPNAPDYAGGTERHVGSNALEFITKTVPGFLELVRGKRVLDYGCGRGDQAIAIKLHGAASVVGYDPYPKFPEVVPYGVQFVTSLTRPLDCFDVVLSSSSWEHFASPEIELGNMRELAGPNGKVVLTWAEPWYSHSGSHMGFFTRVPWVNLLFSERTVMQVRSRYRDDGATSYETCSAGGALNRMTVARYEQIVANSGLKVEWSALYATKHLPFVTRIPLLRELLTSACACILSSAGR